MEEGEGGGRRRGGRWGREEGEGERKEDEGGEGNTRSLESMIHTNMIF